MRLSNVNFSLFQASRFYVIILLLAAVAAVLASLSSPQTSYTSDPSRIMSANVQCGAPLHFVSYSDSNSEGNFAYSTNCLLWNPLEHIGEFNYLLFAVNVVLVFTVLFGLSVVIPRLVIRVFPFDKTRDKGHFSTAVVSAVASAVITSSFFIAHINNTQVTIYNSEFTSDEAVKVVQHANPTLTEYDGHSRLDGVTKMVVVSPGERNQWRLQFVEEKADLVVKARCYLVEDTPYKRQVKLIHTFEAKGDDKVTELDMECQISKGSD